MKTHLVDLRWGKFNLIENDMISSVASYCGEWSDVEVFAFQHILMANSNVIEVGSNIGMHTVPLAQLIPQGKLVCFEPQRIIFQQLCCNIALNNLTNVETYQMGISHHTETQWIETSDYKTRWNYGSFSLNKGFSTENNFTGEISQEEIQIVSLDDFAPIQRLNTLALLKIDAEGFDINVLQGAEKTIKKFQPIIFIEINIASIMDTLAELDHQGYQSYWFISERYQEDNFFGVERKEFGADANLFCIPKNDVAIFKKLQQLIPFFSKLKEAISVEQLMNGEVPFLTK